MDLALAPWFIDRAHAVFLARARKKREAKQRQEMIDAVKIGDKVVTIGGMHGEVVRRE